MGQTYSKNEGQWVDQTLHRVATKEREEIKRTAKQKMARRHNKEGGNHLKQENIRQRKMEGIDRELHLAVLHCSSSTVHCDSAVTVHSPLWGGVTATCSLVQFPLLVEGQLVPWFSFLFKS